MSEKVQIEVRREDLDALKFWVEVGLQGVGPTEDLPEDLAAERAEDIAAAKRFLIKLTRAAEVVA